jgi:hypothetical protein
MYSDGNIHKFRKNTVKITNKSSFIMRATTLYEFWPAQQLNSIYFYPVHLFQLIIFTAWMSLLHYPST